MIVCKSYPRAALIGNPSDGYFGKTIAFVFDNYSAEVSLQESQLLEIIPQPIDRNHFESLEDFSKHIDDYGYYGGTRLIKATIQCFFKYVKKEQLKLHSRNFSIVYKSDIPMRLGLAGSSAIIIACLKALFQFYEIKIANPLLANLALSVETKELKIMGGLQDRVAQVYEQPVFMDFDQAIMREKGFGHYETFAADLLPTLYIAFFEKASEGSEHVHNNLRERFDKGEQKVSAAMKEFATLTDTMYQALKNKEQTNFAKLIDRNFDLRASICPINPRQKKLVDLARELGASAKFTGSGGTIIGTYNDEVHFEKLTKHFSKHRITVIKPNIITHD